MRFVDLFAGLGGFNLALTRLGHTCVFSSEIDEGLQRLYHRNFGLMPAGDLRRVCVTAIPEHHILCAGFPCQPFSKAGDQQGFNCPKWGDLFEHVMRILRHWKPSYFILENVANLKNHGGGSTWEHISLALRGAGYEIDQRRLSPHQYGIPQIRDRLFIVGSRLGLAHFVWPEHMPTSSLSIVSALEEAPEGARALSRQVVDCLTVWQDFLTRFPKTLEIPSFPIWSMESGATYPYEDTPPAVLGPERLRAYMGSHGVPLANLPDEEIMSNLPSYARSTTPFPRWKIDFIRKNRELFETHKHWLLEWIPSILPFPASLQKLEWNCKGDERDLWKHIIQFRASGVRVKRPTTAPSLVAMTSTQVPIIGWQRRYMTPRECARLQSLGDLKYLPEAPTNAYKALGNAVNADLVQMIAQRLVPTEATTD